jgi:hypothetical protein
MPGIRIEISQMSRSPQGKFQVQVRLGDDQTFTAEIADPGTRATEDLLTWYFEVLPTARRPPEGRRREAERWLEVYGTALYTQVFGAEQLSRSLEPYRRAGFEECRLVITGGSEFHRLHWEAMREPGGSRPLSVVMPVQRGIRDPKHDPNAGPPRPSLNVLVVAARPYGAVDPDYRSITRVLLAESWNAERPVRVDLVRPGTWKALEDHLRTTREPADRYQAIHFDLHGVVASPASLREQKKLPVRVRSDEQEGAFLLFESEEPGVAEAIPASEIARLFVDHRVPMAVINSCQSAMFPTDGSSVAEKLAVAGVRVVVGMAWSVTAAAVIQAMPLFYRAIAEGRSPARAMMECRDDLRADALRQLRPGKPVSLQDWLVPVVYQQTDAVDLRLRPMSPAEQQQYDAGQAAAGADPKEVVGRDFDVLAVERLLVGHRDGNQILVHGPAGVGKTWFTTRLLPWWWLRTGLVTRKVVISLEPKALTGRDIVHQIAGGVFAGDDWTGFQDVGPDEQEARVAKVLRARRYLLVIDTGSRPLPAREDLRRFLELIRDGRSLVVIAAREVDEELAEGTFGAKRYALRPPMRPSAPLASRTPPPPPPPPVPLWAAVLGGVGVIALIATLIAQPWSPAERETAAGSVTATATATAGSEPGWVAGPPAPGIVIVSPTQEQTTPACVEVRGTAQGLTADQTILVAARKRPAADDEPFFLTEIADSQNPAPVRTWRARIILGISNEQHFDVYALTADRQSAKEARKRTAGILTSRESITGVRRGAHVKVHQKGGC